MNQDFHAVRDILAGLKADYASCCPSDIESPAGPVTESDIVVDLCHRLKAFFHGKGCHVHCEIRPAPDGNAAPEQLKELPRVDIVVLADANGASWLEAARTLHGRFAKGAIEARFSSVPVEFFHTAVEVKIQSNVANAKKDIDTLSGIHDRNPACNCFFVLLNARGIVADHDRIVAYAGEKQVPIVEHTSRRAGPA